MAINKKYLIIGAVVLVVIIILVVIIASANKNEPETKTQANKKAGVAPQTPMVAAMDQAGVYKDETFPLGIYMKGPSVLDVQKFVNMNGGTLREDGYFGSKTEEGVVKMFGSKTVSKEQFDKMKSGSGKIAVVSVTSYDISNPASLEALIDLLYNDLVIDTYIFSSRDEFTMNGLYDKLSKMPVIDVKTVSNRFNEKYKNSNLAKQIDFAKFSTRTNVDKIIIDKINTI